MLHMSMQAQLTQRQSLVFTPQLQQAIKLLLLNNLELTSYAEKVAEENPFLEVKPPRTHGPLPSMARAASDEFDMAALIPDTGPSGFHARVFAQVDELLAEATDRAIGYALAAHLEPTGWITVSLSTIAANLGTRESRVEQVLLRLQEAEPAGTFARSLSECLLLQVHGCDDADMLLKRVISHLELVETGAFGALRRKLGCNQEDLNIALRALRALDPKPGLALSDGDVIPIREPDLNALQDENGDWRVELNKGTLPAIMVDEPLGRRVRKLTRDDAEREYLRDALGTARWLKRAIAQRNETSIKVAAEIVRHQRGFLEQGMEHMRPLKLKTIADAVGVHESTISRVTSSMMLQTPQGSLPLKVFFSSAIESDGCEEGASAFMLREKIRVLIDAEPHTRPLSDDVITRTLRDQGFHIARRTVAKYRKLDRIPSSSQRRRQYALAVGR